MLSPSKLDSNYKAEMERKKQDPASFGMGVPLPDAKRDLSGSGLTADRDKSKVADPGDATKVPDTKSAMETFLEQSIHDIAPQLIDMDDAELATLHAAESEGRARKGLLEAIEEEQLSRTE